MANSVDPDQTALLGAVLCGSALSACHFVRHFGIQNFRTFTIYSYFMWYRSPDALQSLWKLQDCLTKLANFHSVLQKISVCLTNVLWFLAERDSNLITDKPPVLQKFILSCQKFQSVWQLSCICWKDFAKTGSIARGWSSRAIVYPVIHSTWGAIVLTILHAAMKYM